MRSGTYNSDKKKRCECCLIEKITGSNLGNLGGSVYKAVRRTSFGKEIYSRRQIAIESGNHHSKKCVALGQA